MASSQIHPSNGDSSIYKASELFPYLHPTMAELESCNKTKGPTKPKILAILLLQRYLTLTLEHQLGTCQVHKSSGPPKLLIQKLWRQRPAICILIHSPDNDHMMHARRVVWFSNFNLYQNHFQAWLVGMEIGAATVENYEVFSKN